MFYHAQPAARKEQMMMWRERDSDLVDVLLRKKKGVGD